ncbi:myotubularin-related protein 8 [Agrilus planipennis]|uniref:phosphatidylinositol-3,5-bisphosphate 3-phosphatase n=1 Tax=Agrilus planipennis TaxID=224129 RepID=A0A7F5R5B0_AGRPL|nr:myotubularin-related protein 8 [Agrilus planipennis]
MEFIKTPKIENVQMLDRYSKTPSKGTLYLTATHLIFVDPDAKKETWILHMHIASLERQPLTTTGSPLLIRCKTFLSVTFVIPRERDCHEMHVTLQRLSQPVSIEDLYCFHYTSGNDIIMRNGNIDSFSLEKEYRRMGVPNNYWALTNLNKNYELCETYPTKICVPVSAASNILIGSAKFRSKGRLPVLTYLHKNGASINRCSQPLSGFNARCIEDESLLNHILTTNPASPFMFVVDTRPKINAMANRAAGKGYENKAFYENIKFQFLGIENIHVMRNSLSKIIETCEQKNSSMNSFLSGLESSGWLRHIKAILDTGRFIAQAVEDGVNVVVHCSDGWDRTAQVCSTAAVLLDPYYRTIEGFQALIEKDWLAFGHKFTDRCGYIQGENKEISPIFTQYLDTTWQLMVQYPSDFQFNERFLLTLHDHVMSCQFGTFIGNSEKERQELKLKERTFSLWNYMNHQINEFINPLFCRENTTDILKPNLCPQNIRFWRSMYCRFENGVHPREPLGDLLLATVDHSNSLKDHIKYLNKKIVNAKNFIMENSKRLGKPLSKSVNKTATIDVSDNKYIYDIKQINSSEDSYLWKKTAEGISPCEEAHSKVEELTKNLDSVALDWKTLRNIKECGCSTPFDHFSRKNHCRKCGEVFCVRCIDKQVILPGHLTEKAVPVCRPCYDVVQDTSET